MKHVQNTFKYGLAAFSCAVLNAFVFSYILSRLEKLKKRGQQSPSNRQESANDPGRPNGLRLHSEVRFVTSFNGEFCDLHFYILFYFI